MKAQSLMWQFAAVFSCLCVQTWSRDIPRGGNLKVVELPSPIAKSNAINNLTSHLEAKALSDGISNVTSQLEAIALAANNDTDQFEAIAKGANQQKGLGDAARMPGTNWCGKGWRADGFYKFGAYAGADRCCRQHDLGCHESIEPGQTKYGLTNVRFHAVMHCTCDERFRSCLGMAKTKAADLVGNLFFNVIQIPCFVFVRQRVCKNKTWWGKCLEKEQTRRAIWRQSTSYARV